MTAQCLDWLAPTPTTGWTNFGSAPCDDGSGCPFIEITGFEVWASEAYAVDNCVEGGSYSFSICNGAGGAGTGGMAWTAEFTIIAPSGAVDAFGAGDGDGCTVTWTCSESGSYFIVLNEDGSCGGGANTMTDNGFPALTCTSSPETMCPFDTCVAGILTTTGTVTLNCSNDTFDLNTTDEIAPIAGGFGWRFDNALGGTGGLDDPFILQGIPSPTASTYDADLNGILSSNNFPPLSGTWVIKGAAYSDAADSFNSICELTTDSLIVIFGADPLTVMVTDNGDQTATATAEGGMSPYTYLWSDGQTTETAIDLIFGDTYTVTITDANGCEVEATIEIIELICETGLMLTNGEITVCDDMQFDLNNDGTNASVATGGFGWVFDNSLGGTGALDQIFILFGIVDPTTSVYDNDLNGLLSTNNLPVFAGTWVIKGAVYTDDTDSFNSICSYTADSLIITFSESPMVGAAQDGDDTATATATGGTAPYTYLWSDGQTSETAIDLVTGTYSVTVTEANGCTAETSVDVEVIMDAVDNIESLDAFSLMPNPTSGLFQIDLTLNSSAVVSAQVLDVVGKEIVSYAPTTVNSMTYSIDLKDQAEGVYIVRINIGDQLLTRQVVVSR